MYLEMAFAFIELLSYRVTGKVCDRNHGEIRRLCGEFIERHPFALQPFLFNANSVKEDVKKSKLTGTWAETVDIFSCATLLQRTVFTFSLA